MLSKIADLFVQFSVQGTEAVKTALDAVKVRLDAVQKSVDAVGALATRAMAAGSVAIGGFVTAGIAASGVGQMLAFNMAVLSRTIAGLFGPEIRKAIDLIRSITIYIQSLSETQKANIAKWIEGAFAALTVLTLMPRVVAGINLVIVALKALTLAQTATGWGAIITGIGLILAALAAFLTATDSGREMLGQMTKAFEPLLALGQKLFSALTPVFAAIGSVLKTIISVVVGIVTALAPMVALWARVMALFVQIGALILNVLLAPTRVLWALIGAVFKLLEPIIGAVMQIADAFGEVLDAVMEVFGVLTDAFAELFAALADLLDPVKDIFMDLARLLVDLIVPLIKQFAAYIRQAAADLRALLGLPKRSDRGEGGRGALPPPVGGPEDIGNVFARMQAAALKMPVPEGKTIEERTEQNTRDSAGFLKRVIDLLGGAPDVIRRLV